MGTVVVRLKGGLGNQLFQYSSARGIAATLGYRLIVDQRSGFGANDIYSRKAELERLGLNLDSNWFLSYLFLTASRLLQILPNEFSLKIRQVLKFNFVVEPEMLTYRETLRRIGSAKFIWLDGYWQSAKYFELISREIKTEISDLLDRINVNSTLSRSLKCENSIALCIRNYEETSDPSLLARDGKPKSLKDQGSKLQDLRAMLPDSNTFIFCSQESPALVEFARENLATLVTPEQGYEDALETLKLIVSCKHHIIPNSSLFWWGAYLGQGPHKSSAGVVFAADNFLNCESNLPSWISY